MEFVKILKSKIHGATVTDANVEYEGSITIDGALMEMTGIFEYEAVQVWNKTRGTRLETYAISAPPGSGTICLNGAAALQNSKGDTVIISAFGFIREEDVKAHKPGILFVDGGNRPRPEKK
jgi:aspartate 1-decarboxylase